MTDETNPSTDPASMPGKDPEQRDPVRLTTWVVIVLAVLLFVWYVMADRHTPWTDQARVDGWVVPLAPKVAGRLVEIVVSADQRVKAGDLLLRIQPKEYELAVQRAESALDLARQATGADSAGVDAAKANVDKARADLLKRQKNSERHQRIFEQDPGAVSGSTMESAAASQASAEAALESAVADLERARQQLGSAGEDNAKLRDARAALEQARFDLESTALRAPSAGGITNLRVFVGDYAAQGEAVMTFVSGTDVWVKAYLRENSIAGIDVGNEVNIVLDALPGQVLAGKVASVGFAVSQPSGGKAGEVETVKASSGWLRDAQRFPVIVRFEGDAGKGFRRYGGQADVQFYTDDHPLLNALGRLWIRLMAWLSYVY